MLLIGAASVTAVIAFYPSRLPDLRTADRSALLRCLVTRDLSRDAPDTLRMFAERLEEEFGQEKIDWQEAGGQLSTSQKEQVTANVRVLLEPWLEGKIDRFFATSKAQRTGFLDRTIDSIAEWRGAQALCEGTQGAGSGMDQWTAIVKQIDDWKGRAEPLQQQRINEFLAALQMQWLRRTFLGSLSRGK